MNKQQFLKTLKKRLNFLSEKNLQEFLNYYINEIDKSKEDEKKIIKSFGPIDNIIDDAKKKYNITENSKGFMDKMLNFYKNLTEIGTEFKKGDNKKKIAIIKDLLILVFVTCFFKIPFILLRTFGDQLIDVFLNSNIFYLAIWGLLIEIFYIIFALYYFIRTMNKYYLNMERK